MFRIRRPTAMGFVDVDRRIGRGRKFHVERLLSEVHAPCSDKRLPDQEGVHRIAIIGNHAELIFHSEQPFRNLETGIKTPLYISRGNTMLARVLRGNPLTRLGFGPAKPFLRINLGQPSRVTGPPDFPPTLIRVRPIGRTDR